MRFALPLPLVLFLVVAVAVAVAAGCPAKPAAVAVDVDARPLHREPARAILEVHCAGCHLPDADGGAFRVTGGIATHIFDLQSDDWSATMSDAQLDEAVRKLVDAGAGRDDVAALERFVADEIAWRDGHPLAYTSDLRQRPLLAP